VTGAAGFIGSHLVDRLLLAGHEVRGVDCFTDYYRRSYKEENLRQAREQGAYEHLTIDLAKDDLTPLREVDVVFHAAAQPGVRGSWGSGFEPYVRDNIHGTQRLLEALMQEDEVRLVYSSSSSVYGVNPTFPTRETDLPQPYSPYGVTKLAGEQLCGAYAFNHGLATVALRYFTVYGPRQRPDMAAHRLFEAALGGPAFPMFGDGGQVRDFTYVQDVVSANLAVADAGLPPGTVLNVAGGSAAKLSDLVAAVSRLAGLEMPVEMQTREPGDVRRTGGDTALVQERVGWKPEVGLEEGLALQYDWHLTRSRTSTGESS
jgi:nucleoside-diphosphate-sugar epimerase